VKIKLANLHKLEENAVLARGPWIGTTVPKTVEPLLQYGLPVAVVPLMEAGSFNPARGPAVFAAPNEDLAVSLAQVLNSAPDLRKSLLVLEPLMKECRAAEHSPDEYAVCCKRLGRALMALVDFDPIDPSGVV
jgi:hypothetical protein